MLDPHPRTQLCLILKQHGQVIINEPKRCKGLLNDLAPQNRLEINLLTVALEQKIADDLLNPSELTPIDSQLERLAQSLRDATGIEEELAYWAVESWALALDIIQQPLPKLIAAPSPAPVITATINHRPSRQIPQFIGLMAGIFVAIILVFSFKTTPDHNITPPQPSNKNALKVVDKPKYLPLPEQRDAWTENNLGDTYYYGYGTAQDYQIAAHWYRRAAEQGDAIGQCNLGFMYANGYGVPKDYQQAIYWYRKAAEQGNADGQNNLGILYENGYGVEKDNQQAIEWYRKAVEQGHYGAQQTLKTLLK